MKRTALVIGIAGVVALVAPHAASAGNVVQVKPQVRAQVVQAHVVKAQVVAQVVDAQVVAQRVVAQRVSGNRVGKNASPIVRVR